VQIAVASKAVKRTFGFMAASPYVMQYRALKT